MTKDIDDYSVNIKKKSLILYITMVAVLSITLVTGSSLLFSSENNSIALAQEEGQGQQNQSPAQEEAKVKEPRTTPGSCKKQGLSFCKAGTGDPPSLVFSCANLNTDEQNCGSCGSACGANEVCEGGQCFCFEDETACGETCVDTQIDVNHCGACGNACAEGQTCEEGQCGCPAGQEYCENLGRCADLTTDSTCGDCFTDCNSASYHPAASCMNDPFGTGAGYVCSCGTSGC